MKKNVLPVIMFLFLAPVILHAQTKKPISPKPKAAPVSKAVMDRGKEVYLMNCLACHQADGSGVPNLNPHLVKTKWVLGSKTVLVEQILKGSQGKVEIDGETFNNAMPPLPQLTDQQIADVLTYVRNSFSNKASVVSAGEVKSIRAKIK
ncbi:cytochrome c [Chitinophagaceae bacterium LB-8]|jgi:mono/diheme cytochrome c family protein|uniref:Cytochrome c n=1 Tax=Paraflavisolibacter caeni TaxID=2982496 RepID=A0A9X3B7U7_9BACT|nr:cytochrome c [Paraflavisolibacter caeni]MCU7548886.1 cytochrome c [Paraflavisolibacter caeni]